MEKESRKLGVLIVLMTFSCLLVNSQVSSDFSTLKVIPMNNLDWKQENSKQIISIKNLFLENNIVILSENTHFDGAVRDAQCMILKELIDAGTINTIYLESSWLNINKINAILKEKGIDSIEETLQYCKSQDLQYWNNNGFWNFLAEKIVEGKIELVGFDIGGVNASLAQEMYYEALEFPLINKEYGFQSDANDQLKNDFELLGLKYDLLFPESQYLVVKVFIQKVIAEYSKIQLTKKIKEWEMINSYYDWAYTRQFVLHKTKKYADLDKFIKEKTSYHSLRDSIMAQVFFSHYREKKEVKAIAIMAAYHALNNFRESFKIEECCVEKNTHVLNETLNKLINDSIYSICFVAGSGSYGYDIDGKIFEYGKINPDRKSIEAYFKEHTGYPYLFTDLQSSTISTSFPSAIIFGKTVCADWANIFSGMIFIRKMYPTKFVYNKTNK